MNNKIFLAAVFWAAAILVWVGIARLGRNKGWSAILRHAIGVIGGFLAAILVVVLDEIAVVTPGLITRIGLTFTLFVVLPLSVPRLSRKFAARAGHIASYTFFATLWAWSLLLTWSLWGGGWTAIGIFAFGIGVIPMAFLATIFKSMWSIFGYLICLLILAYGLRAYAFWIAKNANPDLS